MGNRFADFCWIANGFVTQCLLFDSLCLYTFYSLFLPLFCHSLASLGFFSRFNLNHTSRCSPICVCMSWIFVQIPLCSHGRYHNHIRLVPLTTHKMPQSGGLQFTLARLLFIFVAKHTMTGLGAYFIYHWPFLSRSRYFSLIASVASFLPLHVLLSSGRLLRETEMK